MGIRLKLPVTLQTLESFSLEVFRAAHAGNQLAELWVIKRQLTADPAEAVANRAALGVRHRVRKRCCPPIGRRALLGVSASGRFVRTVPHGSGPSQDVAESFHLPYPCLSIYGGLREHTPNCGHSARQLL